MNCVISACTIGVLATSLCAQVPLFDSTFHTGRVTSTPGGPTLVWTDFPERFTSSYQLDININGRLTQVAEVVWDIGPISQTAMQLDARGLSIPVQVQGQQLVSFQNSVHFVVTHDTHFFLNGSLSAAFLALSGDGLRSDDLDLNSGDLILQAGMTNQYFERSGMLLAGEYVLDMSAIIQPFGEDFLFDMVLLIPQPSVALTLLISIGVVGRRRRQCLHSL